MIDALDRLVDPTVATQVQHMLDQLASDSALGHVRLILTACPGISLPCNTEVLIIGKAADGDLERYLQRRGVSLADQPNVLQMADGSWLTARAAADFLHDRDLADEPLPMTLPDLFEARLRRATGGERQFWLNAIRPVLSVLAVASVGPVVPLAVVAEASRRLGGPDTPARVRDVLARLGDLLVRAEPGTPAERVGVFHESFDEFLAMNQELIDFHYARVALLAAIDTLAPPEWSDSSDYLYHYAAAKRDELGVAIVAVALADARSREAALAEHGFDSNILLRQVGNVFRRLTAALKRQPRQSQYIVIKVALANYRLLLRWLIEQLAEAGPQERESVLISEFIIQDIDRCLHLLEAEETSRKSRTGLQPYLQRSFFELTADSRNFLRHIRGIGHIDQHLLDETELAVDDLERALG